MQNSPNRTITTGWARPNVSSQIKDENGVFASTGFHGHPTFTMEDLAYQFNVTQRLDCDHSWSWLPKRICYGVVLKLGIQWLAVSWLIVPRSNDGAVSGVPDPDC
jgi:hypothetical protein